MKNVNERKSIIRGTIIDTKECTFEPFEVETEYTRSEIKAAGLALEVLNLDANRYMVKVNEIVNEAVKPINYDAKSLIDFAIAIYDYDNDAEPTESQIVIEFVKYIYTGQIWAVSGEDYTTESWEYESTVKLGKVDTRAAIAMNYEHENENWRVLAVHNDKREQVKRYALIEREQLAYVKQK